MSRVRLSALVLLTTAALSLTLFAAGPWARAGGGPRLDSLQLVARLPAELPQRVSSLAFDGEKIWVMVYNGRGRHARLDPSTLAWETGRERAHEDALAEVSGSFRSPGGACFSGDRLWVGGSYGDSLGYIDTREWKVGRVFKGKRLDAPGSQSYADLACDGSNVWVAWHRFSCTLPGSETQRLLKLDPETGAAVGEYLLPPGAGADGTHGLTWDGARLWHAKDNRLSAIEPSTGLVAEQHTLPGVRRASGLAWDGGSLWIAEFDGKIWRLLF
jgi:hypothetical protein